MIVIESSSALIRRQLQGKLTIKSQTFRLLTADKKGMPLT